MNELKELQRLYKAGKITKEEYLQQLAELLEASEISQEDYDEAKDYDPAKDDKPIYTQADVDGMIARKAAALVRKALKEAGVTLDVGNRELMAKVAELVKKGVDAKEPATDEKELAELRKKAAKYDELNGKVQNLTLENAVLKAAGKFNPYNPAQVVRALIADYKDLLEFDEVSGELQPKSVEKAIKRIAEVEPNLFKDPEGNGGQPEGFRGKPPGGSSGGSNDDAAKVAKKKAEALELMGLKKPEQK